MKTNLNVQGLFEKCSVTSVKDDFLIFVIFYYFSFDTKSKTTLKVKLLLCVKSLCSY